MPIDPVRDACLVVGWCTRVAIVFYTLAHVDRSVPVACVALVFWVATRTPRALAGRGKDR